MIQIWQMHDECRTQVGTITEDVDLTAMHFHNRLHDIQAQPQTDLTADSDMLNLRKHIKHTMQHLSRNANSRIFNMNVNTTV